jgi:phosphonate transport system ATP-binding protein
MAVPVTAQPAPVGSGAPDHVLRIENLVVRYAASGAPVLRGISLQLRKGEIVGLIGASGAGKSTLLRAVQRLVEPESGRILLGETDVTSLGRRDLRRARRRMGMIFQDFALVDRLTVMENVLSGALGRVGFWQGVRRRFPAADVDEAFRLLHRVGLDGLEDRRCDALSGGQKQRVGIARALIQNPDLLLVDEPTASLDPATSARIMSLITEACEERGLAAIINLHDVPLARRFCPRIVGMRDGRLLTDGPASDLTDERLVEVYGAEALVGPAVVRSEEHEAGLA